MQEHETEDHLLEEMHPFYAVICLLTVILNSYAIWALSLQRYFDIPEPVSSPGLPGMLLGAKLLGMLVKLVLKCCSE